MEVCLLPRSSTKSGGYTAYGKGALRKQLAGLHSIHQKVEHKEFSSTKYPCLPALWHLIFPIKKSKNNALKYQKVYDQVLFLKGKTAVSALLLSQVLGSSTMTNANSVTGLFRYAVQASQQPHQMALSRSQQEEQPSWARTRERNRGKQTEAKYLTRKLQLRPVQWSRSCIRDLCYINYLNCWEMQLQHNTAMGFLILVL